MSQSQPQPPSNNIVQIVLLFMMINDNPTSIGMNVNTRMFNLVLPRLIIGSSYNYVIVSFSSVLLVLNERSILMYGRCFFVGHFSMVCWFCALYLLPLV